MSKKYLFWLINISLSAIFISCNDDDESLDLDPRNSLLETKAIDSFKVKLSTVKESQLIRSDVTDELAIGSYVDAEFGTPTAKTFFQVVPSTDYTINSNAICDSVVLVLDYRSITASTSGGGFLRTYQLYGDSTEQMNFEVFELAESLSSGKEYYTNTTVSIGGKLGECGNRIHQPGADDTLSFSLEQPYGQSILAQLQKSNDRDAFTSVIKGLHIAPDSSSKGAVIGFTAASTKTYVRVYYHDDSAEGLSLNCEIGPSQTRFNTIAGDLSATSIASLLQDGDTISSNQTGFNSFLQSSTGVRTYLEIAGLRDFVLANPTVLINSFNIELNVAEATLPTDGSFIRLTPPPISLLEVAENTGSGVLIKRGAENAKVNVPNQALNNEAYYLYDESAKQYSLELSLYLQEYLKEVRNGSQEEFRLIVSPFAEGSKVDRVVVTDGEASMTPSRVVMYFSTIQE